MVSVLINENIRSNDGVVSPILNPVSVSTVKLVFVGKILFYIVKYDSRTLRLPFLAPPRSSSKNLDLAPIFNLDHPDFNCGQLDIQKVETSCRQAVESPGGPTSLVPHSIWWQGASRQFRDFG